MLPTNRFMKGKTPTYTCRTCGRLTRQTGRGDNDMIDLCAECYDLCGLENMVLDGDTLQACDIERIHSLRAFIASKGGNPDRAFDLALLEGDHA